jgi:hypothetical protein
MAAATAGQRGRRVLLIDHADAVGKKILISGGGRCNFTNVHAAADRYISANPHFAKSALGRYTPADFIALVEAHNIAFHEKTLGQLFCDGSAKQIVQMLLDECVKAQSTGGKVDIRRGQPVGDVRCADGLFYVGAAGTSVSAPALVIATGGPSIPKMGATDFAYRLARQFGLKIVEPRPALVPLTLGGDDVLFRELSGVATEVVAKADKTQFREAALMTHKGLSGPAILQISSYWRHGTPIQINFLPDAVPGWLCAMKRDRPRTAIRSAIAAVLPERLAQVLVDRLAIDGLLADRKDAQLAAIEAHLAAWTFHPNGTEGYAKAEVTAGGISTAEISQQNMMAKNVPGPYVIGEAVDVTGWLGGYNFQWAWASGVAAGQAI